MRSFVVGLCIALLGTMLVMPAEASAAPRASAAPAGASAFTPVPPFRVLDTRSSGGPVHAGGSVALDLSTLVPPTTTAVVLNVTGAEASAPTFVTVFPHGTPRPGTSNLNLAAGDTRPNLVTVMVGADRVIDLYNEKGNVELIADLSGYYSTGAGSRFTPLLSGGRVLDTRTGNPPVKVGAGQSVTIDLSTRVPASATGVVLNVTVTDVTAPTFVTAWPHGQPRPLASNLNAVAGDTVANMVTVPLGTGQKVDLYNAVGETDLLADLEGFYTPDYGAVFVPNTPTRVLDTRSGTGASRTGPIGGNTSVGVFPGTGVPDDAIAAVVNFTGTDATEATFVTAWQFTALHPESSTLNLRPNQSVPNLAVVPLQLENPDRRFYLYNSAGTVDVIGDLAGYFMVPPTPCSSGCAYGWGSNLGDLGVGTTTTSVRTPTPLAGLSGVTRTSGHYALGGDGTVWAWGRNPDGALGNGWYGGETSVPVQVLDLTGVTAVADGDGTGYALRGDGTVWAWGSGSEGTLGPDIQRSARPVRVQGLTEVKAIASFGRTAYALRTDGTVWAWGSNLDGALGNGSSVEASNVPVQVSGLTGVRAIAGGSATYAVRNDGTVWAWGRNDSGQLGNGSTVDQSSVPVQVAGLTNVIGVGGGYWRAFAVRDDGTAWGWGENTHGGLGNGVDCAGCVQRTPIQVSSLTGVRAVAAFEGGGYALLADGTVWAWGYDGVGDLGNPSGPLYAVTPVRVPSLSGVTAIDGRSGGRAVV